MGAATSSTKGTGFRRHTSSQILLNPTLPHPITLRTDIDFHNRNWTKWKDDQTNRLNLEEVFTPNMKYVIP